MGGARAACRNLHLGTEWRARRADLWRQQQLAERALPPISMDGREGTKYLGGRWRCTGMPTSQRMQHGGDPPPKAAHAQPVNGAATDHPSRSCQHRHLVERSVLGAKPGGLGPARDGGGPAQPPGGVRPAAPCRTHGSAGCWGQPRGMLRHAMRAWHGVSLWSYGDLSAGAVVAWLLSPAATW